MANTRQDVADTTRNPGEFKDLDFVKRIDVDELEGAQAMFTTVLGSDQSSSFLLQHKYVVALQSVGVCSCRSFLKLLLGFFQCSDWWCARQLSDVGHLRLEVPGTPHKVSPCSPSSVVLIAARAVALVPSSHLTL